MRLLVVGGGVMGLMAARALVLAGHTVELFERAELPNPLASSIDDHRLIRFAYGDAHGYAAMVAEAFPAWDRLWRDLGRIHYAPTGVLFTASMDEPWVAASCRSLDALDQPWRAYDRAELRQRLPMIDAERLDGALYTPVAGALFARAIALDLVRWLDEAGVGLHPQSDVVAIEPEHATLRLAGGETVRGDRVIVTAGVWAARLLPHLAPRLTPSRQTVLHAEPPAHLAAHWQDAPVLLRCAPGRAGERFLRLSAAARPAAQARRPLLQQGRRPGRRAHAH